MTKKINAKLVYLLTGVFALIYIVFCHVLKDPYQLNIDRWQTLNFSLEYWIHGKYIYDTYNFMGNLSSYLPGQLLLALPSYLLGNVGYLQVMAFLLFSYTILREFKNNMIRFTAILMLGISLSYIYEAVCKSDFISSFMFVAAFILFWHNKFKDNYFQKPVMLGIGLGILFLTRSVAVIPLIIFLLKPFLAIDTGRKIKVSGAFLLTIAVLMLTVFFPAKNVDYIIQHNPLALQGQSNKFVMLFFLVIAIFLSFYVKKISDVFYFSAYIVFLAMLNFVLEKYLLFGLGFYDNLFPTTYLAACLPFSIIAYCFSVRKELEKEI
ncbi:glycosyltransferase family 39 protein [Chryseobacterium luteum]|uniref:glycosyltransferase family 39 protein n=1 Tax=Chryseobacterium luteum TaxID=421531 RepID=UPI0013F3B117|nr:glycosyltransferase family 39 protein [Chryseobacterium luteum]